MKIGTCTTLDLVIPVIPHVTSLLVEGLEVGGGGGLPKDCRPLVYTCDNVQRADCLCSNAKMCVV